MSKILVAGGVHADGDQGDVRARFATALGRQIILGGHTLLGGCRTTLDAYVANSAAETAKIKGQDPTKVIKSWLSKNTAKPAHPHGALMRSDVQDWAQIPRGLVFPEPIGEADAVIIVGGWEGTHYAASWSRLAGKPLLPVASFGGAAADIYRDELAMFDRRYGTRIPLEDYHLLNRILVDESDASMETHAAEVLKLAERTILSSDVFIVMPFEDKGHLKDAYNTFQRVCTRKKFTAMRVDHHLDTRSRIVPAIFSKIRHSAFIIAELSGARPNVFYELGFARALGKAVIHTAYQGTELPFDVYDVPTHYWDSQSELEEKLDAAIDQLTGSLFLTPAAEWHT
jgi:hypothetical protein